MGGARVVASSTYSRHPEVHEDVPCLSEISGGCNQVDESKLLTIRSK